jgi:dipeptidyl aminopeptidase/acylaminoacyl peptidase
MTDLRISPDGRTIAFADHPLFGDNRGTIASVTLSGHKETLTPQFSGTLGLAWSRNGHELYFSAHDSTHQMVIMAVSTGGKVREALNGPGDLTIRDIAPTGEWIVTREVSITRVVTHDPADSVGHFAGWTDFAWTTVLSPDGTMLAMSDASVESGINYSVWLRSRIGARLARLGEGWPEAFTRDGKWVLTIVPTQPSKLMMYPTGPGSERQIPTPAFQTIDQAGWAFDENSLVICGHAAKQSTHCAVQDLNGAPVVRASDPSKIIDRYASLLSPGLRNVRTVMSPDGNTFFVKQDNHITLVDLRNGSTRTVGEVANGDEIARWSPDGRALWVVTAHARDLESVDIATGKRTTVLRDLYPPLGPQLSAGRFTFSDDPRTYAFVSFGVGSDLFAVRGAR